MGGVIHAGGYILCGCGYYNIWEGLLQLAISPPDLCPICIVYGDLSFPQRGEAPVPDGQPGGAWQGENTLDRHAGRNLTTHSLKLLQEFHSILCQMELIDCIMSYTPF